MYAPITGPVTAAVGLFETDSDVRLYAGRVDAKVQGLNADVRAYLTGKYGSASVSSGASADDIAMSTSWNAFYDNWNATKKAIDDSWFIVMSANKYREVEKYDIDAGAWQVKLAAAGVSIHSPVLTQGGAVPGVTAPTNPDAPQRESLAGAIVSDAVKIGLVAGAGYLLFTFAKKKIEDGSFKMPSMPSRLRLGR